MSTTPPSTAAPAAEDIQVGSFFLETLTTGMYEDPFHCIREYVQNGFDAIQDAIRAGDLAAEVGAGHVTGRQVLEAVYPGIKDTRRPKKTGGKVIQLVKAMNPRRPKKTGSDDGIPIKGLIPGMALHFAACCNALPAGPMFCNARLAAPA